MVVRPEEIPAKCLRADTAPVVHVAAMPLPEATAIVRHVREQAPDTLITVDTHWSSLQTEAGAAPLVLLGAHWPRLLRCSPPN